MYKRRLRDDFFLTIKKECWTNSRKMTPLGTVWVRRVFFTIFMFMFMFIIMYGLCLGGSWEWRGCLVWTNLGKLFSKTELSVPSLHSNQPSGQPKQSPALTPWTVSSTERKWIIGKFNIFFNNFHHFIYIFLYNFWTTCNIKFEFVVYL